MMSVACAARLARRAAFKALPIFSSAESDVSSISRPQLLQEPKIQCQRD
jgi:hypothetical protein